MAVGLFVFVLIHPLFLLFESFFWDKMCAVSEKITILRTVKIDKVY